MVKSYILQDLIYANLKREDKLKSSNYSNIQKGKNV